MLSKFRYYQKATDQEKVDQLFYAFDYEGVSPIDLENYFDNLPLNGELNKFKGHTTIENHRIPLDVDIIPLKKYRHLMSSISRANWKWWIFKMWFYRFFR